MLLSDQQVGIAAEKVTASLNQVSGAEDLKLFNEERITPNNPTNNFHHQAWSTTGSIGIGLDGKINPSITPSFERDGVRTSIILSRDLFEGMNMLHNWLEKTFREDPTITSKGDFIKPIKEVKPKQAADKEPNPNTEEQVLENSKNEFIDKINKVIENRIDALNELNSEQKEIVKKAVLQDMQSL